MVMTEGRTIKRIVALILAVLMVVSIVPVTVLAEETTGYEFVVDDGESLIDKAEISYSVFVGDDPIYSGTLETENGKVKLPEIDDLDLEAAMAEGKTVRIDYVIVKDGYVSKEDSVEITEDSATINVTLEKVPPEKRTVTVNKKGEGSVEIDGKEESSVTVEKGTEVTLKVSCSSPAYIKEVKIGNDVQTISNESAFEKKIKVDENTEVSVTFVNRYTVSVSSNEGGTISINGKTVAEKSFDEDSAANISVKADENYQILSISIGPKNVNITDVKEYNAKITVNSDTKIEVKFVRVYKVKVTFDNEKGAITTDPSAAGGTAIVKKGSDFQLVATPAETYRVSKVSVSGMEDEVFDDNKYNNSNPYKKTLSVEKDYDIEVTFSPLVYKITVDEVENGKASVNFDEVEYNGEAVLTIKPGVGYVIDKVTVNDVNMNDSIDIIDEDVYELKIADIKEDKDIKVTFKKAETASLEDVDWNYDDALRFISSANKYIFKPGTDVVFSTEGLSIKVFYSDGKTDGGVKSLKRQKSVKIDTDKTIEKIEIRVGKIKKIVIEETIQIVFDKKAPEAEVTPEKANQYDYYNSDVTVDYKINDKDDYSGLDIVEYWIECDGEETARETLYDYSEEEKITPEFEKKIFVDSIKNNSDDVKVFFKSTDRAGNEVENSVDLKINSTRPVIKSVSIDGKTAEDAVEGYYNANRTATVVIEDRATCFNEELANDAIIFDKVKDFNGKDVNINKAAMISWSSDGDTHIGVITFDVDAQYEWKIEYTNTADLTTDGVEEENGESIYKFAVDKKSPQAKITVEERAWDTILTTLTFGIWKNYEISPVADGFDTISGVQEDKISYYKTTGDAVLSEEDLEKVEFQNERYAVSSDEDFVVYAKVMDLAGNIKYVSTNGIIVDTTKSIVTLTPDEPNEFSFYNKDVNIGISVDEEAIAGKAYSGIKNVSYEVVVNQGKEDEKVTQKGVLYNFDFVPDSQNKDIGTLTVTDWDSDGQKNTKPVVKGKTTISKSELKKEWTGTLVVDSEKNNYDDVRAIISVTDNAGNTYSEEYRLSINITKPEVSISYGNDKANMIDSEFDGNERGYFGQKRVATITIKDRPSTFYEEDALTRVVYSAVDGKNTPITFEKTAVGKWAHDGEIHTLEVVFEDDGNYDFSFSYINKADLEPEKIDTGKSVTPYFFTVDTVNPLGTVTVRDNVWDVLSDTLFFDNFSNVKVDVSATSEDATSPTIIEYYKTSDYKLLDQKALDSKKFEPFEGSDVQKNGIEPNERFVIYLKISDYAGNYYYVNTDGHIIDNVASDITIKPEDGNGFYGAAENNSGKYGLYNHDVKVNINVKDAEPYSGIKTVEVWTEMDGKVTQESKVLFNFTNEKPKYEDLVQEWNGEYTVDSKLNNGCDVVVYVKTVDNAGNENTESVNLDIDISAPEVSIRYDNNSDNNGNTYFNKPRTATITIKERTHHFDNAAATKAIIISAVDVNGAAVNNAYTLSSWSTKEGATPDEATHTATIRFEKDANYQLMIGNDTNTGIIDKADNANKTPDVTGQTAPYKFTVDTTAPEGTITAKSQEGREETWSDLIESLTFGFWSNKQISVSGTWKDATSPIASVEYYMPTSQNGSDETTAYTASDLDRVTSWKNFDDLDVNANNQFTVYLKITDNAGNYTYISTNGLIVDDQRPNIESVAPEITVTPEKPVNGIYKDNVKVDIKVVDPLTGGTYSGLKEVTYKVYDRGGNTPSVPTQEGQLYLFNNTDPKQSELLETWEGSITVDSSKNNSNDVQIVVTATDNAENYVDNVDKESQGYTSIKIDTTAPVIDISYNNNSADSGTFFKANRTATIKVTERNFDPKDVKVTIKNTDKVIPAVVGWHDTQGKANNDNATHTATITYSADGDYTFDIAFTDMAGNKCEKIRYAAGTVAAKAFTIDKTIPKISVRYNNNAVSNGRYFKDARTATVTVTEHNFDLSRVKFKQTAALGGSNITIPHASWSTSGNNHIATINYSADGDYTFDISVKDKAGNESGQVDYGNSQAAKEFTVDKTIEKPHITGIENGKAYNGDVLPGVSFTDVNFDSYKIKLTRTRLNEIDKDVTSEFITGVGTSVRGGSAVFNTFEKTPENDGIYTLNIQYTDKAGNSENETYKFTVNRFGSIYVYDDYLVSLIKDGGTFVTSKNGPAINKDLVITEYNPDRLKEGSLKILITRDGQTLDAKYITSPAEITSDAVLGASGWFEYLYTISKDNFKKDGLYKISILSEDETGNSSTSMKDNTSDGEGNRIVDSISFTVDTTPPQIRNITNLDKPIVNAQTLTVKYTVIDVGGLKSIEVYYGKDKQVIKSFKDLNNYSGEFVVKESSDAQTIRIKVTDLAGNVTDTASETFDPGSLYVFNDSVTVSTNAFVRWYANKLLFFGTIGGAAALAAGITFFIIFYKRKKEDEE